MVPPDCVIPRLISQRKALSKAVRIGPSELTAKTESEQAVKVFQPPPLSVTSLTSRESVAESALRISHTPLVIVGALRSSRDEI